jgi:hypothetical protein
MAKSLKELEATLRATWNERPSSDNPRPRSREKQIKALRATAAFFESNGLDPSIVHEFRIMASALSDLDKGAVAPFLEPENPENRRQDDTQIWLARAMVAIAVDVIAGETGNQRASSRTIDRMAKHWSGIFGSDDFAEAARKWHRDFATRRAKNRDAQSVFDSREDMLAKERQDLSVAGIEPTPETVARMVLEYARVAAIRARGITHPSQLHGLG